MAFGNDTRVNPPRFRTITNACELHSQKNMILVNSPYDEWETLLIRSGPNALYISSTSEVPLETNIHILQELPS
jgi:hypothetical protein